MSSSEAVTPRSVLIVMPRWVRDGGVGAHLMRSAAALAGEGVRVSVLVARIETEERVEGVELLHSPRLYKTDAMDERFGEALACRTRRGPSQPARRSRAWSSTCAPARRS